MPRIRSIKPEIHQDEAIGDLSDSAFRLFIGLITQADDHGRLKGGLTLISAQVWPYRPRPTGEVDTLLSELEKAALIQRYEVGGKPYICLPGWAEHQRIDNAGKPRCPSPTEADSEDSPRVAASRREPPLDQGGDQGSRRGGDAAASAATDSGHKEIIQTLDRVAFSRNLPSPKPEVVTRACKDHTDRDLPAEVAKFDHYWTHGPGERRSLSDVAWAWRQWLGRADPATPQITQAPDRVGPDNPYDRQVREIAA